MKIKKNTSFVWYNLVDKIKILLNKKLEVFSMNNFTTNTYEMKREIVKFSKKICEGSSKPENKFVTDMIYGISKSKDVLLSSIADALNENTKKAFVIDRLSDNLSLDLGNNLDKNYCNLVMDSLGENPVFLVDDSDREYLYMIEAMMQMQYLIITLIRNKNL